MSENNKDIIDDLVQDRNPVLVDYATGEVIRGTPLHYIAESASSIYEKISEIRPNDYKEIMLETMYGYRANIVRVSETNKTGRPAKDDKLSAKKKIYKPYLEVTHISLSTFLFRKALDEVESYILRIFFNHTDNRNWLTKDFVAEELSKLDIPELNEKSNESKKKFFNKKVGDFVSDLNKKFNEYVEEYIINVNNEFYKRYDGLENINYFSMCYGHIITNKDRRILTFSNYAEVKDANKEYLELPLRDLKSDKKLSEAKVAYKFIIQKIEDKKDDTK